MKTTLIAALLLLPAVAVAAPMTLTEGAEARASAVDMDGDGITDGRDNCRDLENATQADADRDGIGDACDEDDDNDGVTDRGDNCMSAANHDQTDSDIDGVGDVCDTHFDTGATVDLIVAIASRSSERLPASVSTGALSNLEETVSLIGSATREWDAKAISRPGYQLSLQTALYTLMEFDTHLAASVSKGQLSTQNAAILRDASAGIRQLVANLYVRE